MRHSIPISPEPRPALYAMNTDPCLTSELLEDQRLESLSLSSSLRSTNVILLTMHMLHIQSCTKVADLNLSVYNIALNFDLRHLLAVSEMESVESNVQKW